MTNADAIRDMTDEELAELLYAFVEPCFLCAWKGTVCTQGDCEQGRLAWLRQEKEG